MKNILSIIILLIQLLMLEGCSKSELDMLYTNCIVMGMKEQMIEWQESDRPSVRKGVEKMCNLMIKECKSNSDSEMCISFKTKFKSGLK